MWLVLTVALLGQADDILADEAATSPAAIAEENNEHPNDLSTANSDEDGSEAQPSEADDAPPDEEVDAAVEDAAEESGFLDRFFSTPPLGYFRSAEKDGGGMFMWPILLCAILGSGVIIERYRSLKMLATDSSAVRLEVQNLLQADRIEEAMELCQREQGPVPAVLSAGLRQYLVLRRLKYDAGKIEAGVVKAMEDYSVHIVAALERHLPILATISSVAPMLGFLGTVAGMITSFDNIRAKFGQENIIESAAGGISVALLTTCFGLIVGIPAFIAYNYFTSVINRFVLQVEESSTELIESVTLQNALEKLQPGSANGDGAAGQTAKSISAASDG